MNGHRYMSKFIIRKENENSYHIFRMNNNDSQMYFCSANEEAKAKIIMDALVEREERVIWLDGQGKL